MVCPMVRFKWLSENCNIDKIEAFIPPKPYCQAVSIIFNKENSKEIIAEISTAAVSLATAVWQRPLGVA